MSSLIDATVPADNVKADKALFRQNFRIAKDEITALQTDTSVARVMAISNIEMELETYRNQVGTNNASVAALDVRMTIAEGNITTLQTNVTTLQSRIRVPYRMAFDDTIFRTA